VVIAVIAVLMSILGPVVAKIRSGARAVAGMNNQRQIINAVNLFAIDHDDEYPESVATLGREPGWNWGEPLRMIGFRSRSPRTHRSMSAYLRAYLADAGTLYCPSAPKKYKYLDEAWAAGDDWDNPDTPMSEDAASGTYSFYWNYTGYLDEKRYLFEGPRGPAWGGSKLLVSCYFGYGRQRTRDSYASCQRFPGADITEGSLLSCALWSSKGGGRTSMPAVKLYAGYMDGRVESFSSTEASTMRAIKLRPAVPYPDGIGPGDFYLPRNALR